jgi:hypothetical protein
VQNGEEIMKKQMKHQNGNGHTTQRIRIEFTHPTASEVAIAGTFNDWRPDWLCRRAFMNTDWSWTALGWRIHAPAKQRQIRLGERIQF